MLFQKKKTIPSKMKEIYSVFNKPVTTIDKDIEDYTYSTYEENNLKAERISKLILIMLQKIIEILQKK